MQTSADLLIELGTEELPPKALPRLSAAFTAGIRDGLVEAGFEVGEVQSFATPRRLAVLLRNIPASQADREVERRGPAVAAAFDTEGKPRPAAEGFARSCGVAVEDLQRIDTDKGEYLSYAAVEEGRQTADVIPGIVEESLKRLPIPKRMRWGDMDASFVRPVQWLLALHGEDVLPFSLFDLHTDRLSRGHRFHHPASITLQSAADYEQALLDGRVIADFAARREKLRAAVLAAADELGGKAILDEELLDEVTALVEWPVPVTGRFDERFLEMPKEVLVTALQEHQRYFCVEANDGRLLNAFITLSNLQSQNPIKVQEGNERVVRPRLADALFFWTKDRKQPLADFLPGLEAVTYVKEIGSLADKSRRVQNLAAGLAAAAGADLPKVKRAAELAKADLLTDMVFEFTELQGVMGRYYAAACGEDAEVAQAIDEQYWPRFAGDAIPATATGRVLALADKFDSLAGIFAIGKRPTGDRDPYGLRRASLGLLRILLEAGISIDLKSLLGQVVAAQPVSCDQAEVAQALFDFMMDRARGLYTEREVAVDIFEAVRANHISDPLDFDQRIHAVQAFLNLPEAEQLAAAHKRVRNILKKESSVGSVDAGLLAQAEEKALHAEAERLLMQTDKQIQAGEYSEALASLASLRAPVDAFFDAVMVMDEDAAVRANRLALLG
ncbi:MAG: glycine--tRNA ligase subunit beta, partial [Nevskiales bacterium]